MNRERSSNVSADSHLMCAVSSREKTLPFVSEIGGERKSENHFPSWLESVLYRFSMVLLDSEGGSRYKAVF